MHTTENIHLTQPVAHCEAWEAERALAHPRVSARPYAPAENREIDFARLKNFAASYAQQSCSDAGEMMRETVYALEQWERCGGRKWAGFHDLLDAVNRILCIPS